MTPIFTLSLYRLIKLTRKDLIAGACFGNLLMPKHNKKKLTTNLGKAIKSKGWTNTQLREHIDQALAKLGLKDDVDIEPSDDLISNWKNYKFHPTDPTIRKALSVALTTDLAKLTDSVKLNEAAEKYYQIVAPNAYVLNLLEQRILEFNQTVDNNYLILMKEHFKKRPPFTTMRNEGSSHARWEQLFEAIFFCQLQYHCRSCNLVSLTLTTKLYNQLMDPKILLPLVNTDLLSRNIKEYVDSTPVIYDRSIQLIAVRTLLMSIDGNYLLLE